MDIPGITGLSASLEVLNGWFAGASFGLIRDLNITNNITVNLARALVAAKGWA
jgi:hypothetical protein